MSGDTELQELGAVDTWTHYLSTGVKRVNAGLSFQHKDGLESNRLTTYMGSTSQNLHDYGPYGEPLTAILSGKGYINERYDPETELQYLHARYYDPVRGQFLTPDTWDSRMPGVGTNRYAYSSNDPINRSDAMGHRENGHEEDGPSDNGGPPSGGIGSGGAGGGGNRNALTNFNGGTNGNPDPGLRALSAAARQMQANYAARGYRVSLIDLAKLLGRTYGAPLGRYQDVLPGIWAAPGFCCDILSIVVNKLDLTVQALTKRTGFEYFSYVYRADRLFGHSAIYTSGYPGQVGGFARVLAEMSIPEEYKGSIVASYHNHPSGDNYLSGVPGDQLSLNIDDFIHREFFAGFLGTIRGVSQWELNSDGDWSCTAGCN